jgi:uncharacterized cofD-like protein
MNQKKLVSSLKNHFAHITALVNMADDGGSTGILRDELGVLPPGDVRQCLVALARNPRVRDLFNYRFDEGTFAGHSFGNLFLTAVQKVTDDFASGVELAGEILHISGRVVPITLDNVTLVHDNLDGTVTRGQHTLQSERLQLPRLRLEPVPKLNPAAKTTIAEADLIVVAPGNLYASLAPALLVPGVAKALAASHAKKAYICNLVTKPGQTDGFTVADFAAEIERFIPGVTLDYVLYNNAKPDVQLLKKYANKGEFWVEYNATELQKQHYKAIGGHFVLDTSWQQTAKKDLLARTLIRHNAETVTKKLQQLA